MLPATVTILILARPLVQIIFERGSFSSASTEMTAFALLFYCLSLTGYAGIKILASCFYALRDTLTPAKVALVALGINIVLNLILIWPLKVGGLALATAISVTVNFILLFVLLKKRIGPLGLSLSGSAGVLAAAMLMGATLWFLFYGNDFLSTSSILLALKLALSFLLSLAVYFAALKVLAKEEAQIFSQWISRKR